MFAYDDQNNNYISRDVLQRSVPEHDPVEGQRSGDRILLHELHEGEARRLRLVAGHAHELDVAHLLEELQQLLGSGGLWGRGRGTELSASDEAGGGGLGERAPRWPLT